MKPLIPLLLTIPLAAWLMSGDSDTAQRKAKPDQNLWAATAEPSGWFELNMPTAHGWFFPKPDPDPWGVAQTKIRVYL